MTRNKYLYCLFIVIFSAQAESILEHKCDTNIKQVVLSNKVYGALALGSFIDSSNKTTFLSVTPHVQLWQKSESQWENIATLKPLCLPQTAQAIINTETNEPLIVVGAGSCFSVNNKKGAFVVWQQEEDTWKATSSDVESSGQPFTYIDAYFTNTTSAEPVIAAGYSNQTALFFENNGNMWQEVSSLERVVKSFYIPGYGQCAVSQGNSNNVTVLEFWLYTNNIWELVQSFDIGEDTVYAADYALVDGLPAFIAGTAFGQLVTAQLQDGAWVFSKQNKLAGGGTISSIAHVQQADQTYLIIPDSVGVYIHIYHRIDNSWRVLKTICLNSYGDYVQGTVGGFVDEDNNFIVSAGYGDMYCSWTESCELGLFYVGNITGDSQTLTESNAYYG